MQVDASGYTSGTVSSLPPIPSPLAYPGSPYFVQTQPMSLAPQPQPMLTMLTSMQPFSGASASGSVAQAGSSALGASSLTGISSSVAPQPAGAT